MIRTFTFTTIALLALAVGPTLGEVADADARSSKRHKLKKKRARDSGKKKQVRRLSGKRKVRAKAKTKSRTKRRQATKAPRVKRVKRATRVKRVARSSRRSRKSRWPAMSLVNVNTREKLQLSLFDRRGRTDRKAVKRLYRFLRCSRTQRRRRIAWRLLRNLYSVSRAYPGKKIYVYSGYRYKRRNRRSKHNHGRAIDFRVAGVPNHKLQAFVRKRFKNVGVGYYPNSYFIHMDVRSKRAFWVDHSGPGERARYARKPYEALADSLKRMASRSKPSNKGTKATKAKIARIITAPVGKVASVAVAVSSTKVAGARDAKRPQIVTASAVATPAGKVIDAKAVDRDISGPAPVGPSPSGVAPAGIPAAPPPL